MADQNHPADESKESKDHHPETNRIIVIGASAGGFGALKRTIAALPADFSTPIFIVWHMSPDVKGFLPQALNGVNSIVAAHAYHDEAIRPGRIYVAPPDHHMLLEEGIIKVTRGPKENRFRPAVDPLFRSAAYVYGARVIGVILSGALDDGTAGLLTVKQHGGTAIVQDPLDAEVPSMPENALRQVAIDYCVPVAVLPQLLVRLANEPISENPAVMKDEQTKKEIQIASEERALEKGVLQLGDLSPFSCPECHGVLARLQNDTIIRYRCHTGHAYSADALMEAITEKVEEALYSAIRGMDETIMLLNHIGDHYAEANQPKKAALYFKKAKEAGERSEWVRKAALMHEHLNNDTLRRQAEEQNNPAIE